MRIVCLQRRVCFFRTSLHRKTNYRKPTSTVSQLSDVAIEVPETLSFRYFRFQHQGRGDPHGHSQLRQGLDPATGAAAPDSLPQEDGSLSYDLPGGGQRPRGTLEQTVAREVLEETGYQVHGLKLRRPGREIHEDPARWAAYPDYAQRVLHIFWAELGQDQPVAPTKDLGQGGRRVECRRMRWRCPICIRAACRRFSATCSATGLPRYLGCVHIYG